MAKVYYEKDTKKKNQKGPPRAPLLGIKYGDDQ
jgi:hypothetical protein